ncbi:MAG: ATP-binding protein [Melioribacteraceae bacterium]
MNANHPNTEFPENNCPLCGIKTSESYPLKTEWNARTYSCDNCGLFSITYMAYRFTPIINDPVTKQKISYYVRIHQDKENPILLKQSEIDGLLEKTKLPSVHEQINILLGWIGLVSKLSLETVEGNTKHLIARLGCMNQSQVIHVLDEIWKLGYIEMENPTVGPLRDRPLFGPFACHLTVKGIVCLPKNENKPIKKNYIEELLLNEESTNFEIKGSCKLDINRLLRGDGKTTSSNQIAIAGVLKTIVAFLNSSGGDIVIGALEKDKFSSEQMSNIHFAEYGNYYLIGVKIESDNIDIYELYLRNIIESHISRSIVGLLEITFSQIVGFTLCQISVNKAEHKWYYLDDDKFYVRAGNQTVSLKGNDADEHKKRNPR